MDQTGRKPLRPATKIVNAPKSQPAWPLERARLQNRHTAAMQIAEQARRRDVSFAEERGLERGRQEVLKAGMDDADFRKYLFRSVAERLGDQLAERMTEDFRRVDPVLQERRRLFDARLAVAELSVDFGYREISKEAVLHTRVDLPKHTVHFATIL